MRDGLVNGGKRAGRKVRPRVTYSKYVTWEFEHGGSPNRSVSFPTQ